MIVFELVYRVLMNAVAPARYPVFSDEDILRAVENTDGTFRAISEYVYKGEAPSSVQTHLSHKIEDLRDIKLFFRRDVPRHYYEPGKFGRSSRWLTERQLQEVVT